jgi:hypothetical protein
VKKALDALRAAQGTAVSGSIPIILAVKELFLSPWHRLMDIFKMVT